MRKTLATIVLALGLVFSVVPAFGDAGPTTLCTSVGGGKYVFPDGVTPCDPSIVCSPIGGGKYVDLAGEPCSPASGCVATSGRRALAVQQAIIARQHRKIQRQAALIKRLRHRLATR